MTLKNSRAMAVLVLLLVVVATTILSACGGSDHAGQGAEGPPSFITPAKLQTADTPVSNPAPLTGTMKYFDENKYWAINKISDTLYQIHEPNYSQANSSYLLIGKDRSLLFDSGAAFSRDITKVVKSLTSTHVTVMPSHLHYDHIGGLPRFGDIWMIDVPYVRALQGQDGRVTIPPEVHIAALDGPTYGFVTEPLTISRWIASGTTVDLGGKQVQVVSTPGHNDSEVVLYDLTDNVLLTGDHMYPGPLYDEKTELYSQSAAAVLKFINPTTRLYGAHGDNTLMTYQDGADLDKTLRQIVNNEVQGTPIQRPDLSALEYVVNSTLRVWRYLKFAVGIDFGKS